MTASSSFELLDIAQGLNYLQTNKSVGIIVAVGVSSAYLDDQ